MTCPSSHELLAQFVERSPHGIHEVGPAGTALTDHLAACPTCSDDWARFAAITEHVGGSVESFVDLPLQEEILARTRLATAEVVPPRPRLHWQLGAWGALPLAAAAALAFWLVPRGEAPTLDGGFQARGGLTEPADRWVGVTLYRTSRDAPGYERVTGAVYADDALLFGYLNRPEGNYRYLAALAVDGAGQIFWYHPSLSIVAAAEPQELREAITQPLSPGWLRIYGLFSHEPLGVDAIEQAVRAALARDDDVTRLGRLPLANTGQHTFLVKVEP